MMPDCLSEIKSIIDNQFTFLIEDHGFRTIHSESLRAGKSCFYVLESNECRLKIDSELGFVNLYFGRRNAPLKWGDEGWYYIGNILEYIERKMPSLEEILAEGRKSRGPNTAERMTHTSARLKAVCDRVIGIFGDVTGEKIRQLEEHIGRHKEQIRRDLDERPAAQSRNCQFVQ